MLALKETVSANEVHLFNLSSVILGEKISFELTSETYTGVTINFTLESERFKIHPNYSVSVHLFKSSFFSQKDIVDLRVEGLTKNKGKLGYFFRLDALFEKDTLQINEHTFSYAYYAIEHLFSNGINLQTKEVELNTSEFKITDFFDEDTIILVLCNEYCSSINNFSLSNYLAQLFLNGFISFSKAVRISLFNQTSIVQSNYDAFKTIVRSDGVFVLRIPSANSLIIGDDFVAHLFQNLLQQKNDPTTRFIIIYQVIEIFISKIFHLKIQSKVCDNLNNLTSIQLKDFLSDIQKEKFRITSLLNSYARPSAD